MNGLSDTLPDQPANTFPDPSPDREERLQAALRELERRFGPWVVYRLKDARPPLGDSAISTGSLSLDLATGIGGFPRGRIAELIGPPSSGKSTLAFHFLANAQRQSGFATLVDTTHQASFEQMGRCGVNLTDLFLVVPESAHEALEVAALLVESGGLDALAIGPLAGLIGGSPRVAQATAKQVARLNAGMHASPTAVLFLTDERITPASLPVSRPLRHFASLRVHLTPLRVLLHPSGDIRGLRVQIETIKNKLAPAGRPVEVDLLRERGVHREAELIDLGLARAILEERSLGICFGLRLLGRGRARAIAALEQDPSLARELSGGLRVGGWGS
ncbi:MAG TPA: ATPase domain-containing protein [Chloroflexota bacterium]|nr:ATPase domain-containing protein [Chloroflexota bacterium]